MWMDESQVNAGHTNHHAWMDDTIQETMTALLGKGSHLILLHAGLASKFVPNVSLCFHHKNWWLSKLNDIRDI